MYHANVITKSGITINTGVDAKFFLDSSFD